MLCVPSKLNRVFCLCWLTRAVKAIGFLVQSSLATCPRANSANLHTQLRRVQGIRGEMQENTLETLQYLRFHSSQGI